MVITGSCKYSANRDKALGGAGQEDSTAQDQHRFLGGQDHVDGMSDLHAVRLCLGDGQWGVGLRVVGDVSHLHIKRQVNEHRARPALASQPERLAQNARHLPGLGDTPAAFADRLADGGDVYALERLFA